jgi:lysocardiolipin and lysophospholipid acyltransferase
MQLFRFVFLARSWESDRRLLARRLAKLGQRAHDEDVPLSFMFFPEGTLVSKDTRPISKKFADKSGIVSEQCSLAEYPLIQPSQPDMEHTLLPRSTGLQYVLRSLAPRIPDLHLLDLTIAYPGVPPRGYGQSYYTLRSIFFARVPPPAVHIHIRRFRARDTPMGELGPSDAGAVEVEVPTHEKVAFEEWVRGLWRRKDEMIDRFHATGTFAPAGRKDAEVAIPVKLRTAGEYVQAYGGFAPVLAGYALWRLKGQ